MKTMLMKPQPDDDDQYSAEAASPAIAQEVRRGGEFLPAAAAGHIVTGLIGLGIGAFFALIFALMTGLIAIC